VIITPEIAQKQRRDQMRASFRCHAWLMLLLWMVHQPVLAQPGHPVPPSNAASGRALGRLPLSLREAVQLALKPNPRQAIAHIEVEQRRRAGDQAIAKLLPHHSSCNKWQGTFQTPGSYAPVTVLVDERSHGVHISYDTGWPVCWLLMVVPTPSRSREMSTRKWRPVVLRAAAAVF